MAQRWTEHVVCIGFERYSRLRSFHHPCISFSFDIILGYFFHFAFQDTSASTLLGVRPEILHHEARTQNSLSQNDRYSIDLSPASIKSLSIRFLSYQIEVLTVPSVSLTTNPDSARSSSVTT